MSLIILSFADGHAVSWRNSTSTAALRAAYLELRQAQPARGVGADGVASNLSNRLPVLLVDFPDRPHSELVPQDSVHANFFGAGASVRSFYGESSYGRYQLEGTTTASQTDIFKPGQWYRITGWAYSEITTSNTAIAFVKTNTGRTIWQSAAFYDPITKTATGFNVWVELDILFQAEQGEKDLFLYAETIVKSTGGANPHVFFDD